MQISKWGNSLAVRLPKAVVDQLELKEGDEIELVRIGERTLEVRRVMTREEALAEIRKLRGSVPADYIFNRDEIYDEGDK